MIIFRTLLEEIVIQRFAYLEKQRHCNPLLVEDFVKIFRRAVYLLGQPDGRATLLSKLLLDNFSKVKTVGCCCASHIACLSGVPPCQQQKRAVPVLLPIPIEGVWNSLRVNKLETVHALRREPRLLIITHRSFPDFSIG